MAVSINSNVLAQLVAQRLRSGADTLSRTFERLSSGQRINHASDDAAGLAISSGLRAQSRVLTQGIRNINDGLSALSVAQGAMSELSATGTRLLELATQSANGSLSTSQRRSLSNEADQLVLEFNRTLQTTQFNGLNLLDRSLRNMRIQAGFGLSGSIAVDLSENLAQNVGGQGYETGTALAGGGAGVATADFNGDGRADLVSGTQSAAGVRVQIANSSGGFTAANYGGAANYFDVAVGDVNGDGKQDIVGASASAGVIHVYLGQGNGTFSSQATIMFEAAFYNRVELGDLNGDGALDIIAGNGVQVSTRLGNGNGTFQALKSISTDVTDIQIADVNGDGREDVISASDSTDSLSVLLSDTAGALTITNTYAYGTGGRSAVLGDFNRDGFLDLVGSTGGQLGIRMGNGDGTFGNLSNFAGTNALRMEAADINGDGLLDIAIVNAAGAGRITFGDGLGGFSQTPTALTTSGGNLGVAVADFNGDGAIDVATAGMTAAGIEIWAATPQSVTSIGFINLQTRQGALDALDTVQEILERIGLELGGIGQGQSRLETALANLHSSVLNTDAASSRITDVDVASEAAELTRQTILQQTGAAVLAQANQLPQISLSLLRNIS